MLCFVLPVMAVFLANESYVEHRDAVAVLVQQVLHASLPERSNARNDSLLELELRERQVMEDLRRGNMARWIKDMDEHLRYPPQGVVWLWHQDPSVAALVDMGRSGPANRDKVLGSVLGELRMILKHAKEEGSPLGSSTVEAMDKKNGADGLVAVLGLLDAGEDCFPLLLEMFTFAEGRDWVREALFVSRMTGVPRREARGNSNMQLALVFTLENALNRMSRETLQREGVGEEARKALETYRAYRDARIEALRKDCVTDECRDRTTEQWDIISSGFSAYTPDLPFKDPTEATVCTARAYLGLALDPVGTRMIARERAAGSVPK